MHSCRAFRRTKTSASLNQNKISVPNCKQEGKSQISWRRHTYFHWPTQCQGLWCCRVLNAIHTAALTTDLLSRAEWVGNSGFLAQPAVSTANPRLVSLRASLRGVITHFVVKLDKGEWFEEHQPWAGVWRAHSDWRVNCRMPRGWWYT